MKRFIKNGKKQKGSKMKFLKIEIGEDEEIILNMKNISILEKKEKFITICSDSAPYHLERTKKENEYDYFVWLRSVYRGAFALQVTKENYELIKSKLEG